MIFQFGIVAIGAICATILALAGQASAVPWIMGGCFAAFFFSML